MWGAIVASRFLVGVGVGGTYPLGAAKASAGLTADEAIAKAAWGFMWMGPGMLAPYMFSLLLLALPLGEALTSVQFRLLFAGGAVPSLIALLALLRDSEDALPDNAPPVEEAGSLCWALAGTGGTWLLFDIVYYGVLLFLPVIMQDLFGRDLSLGALCLRSMVPPACWVCGVLAGTRSLRALGPKALLNVSMALCAAVLLAFAAVAHACPDAHVLLFCLLCLAFALLGGPSISTYVMPVVAFPPEVRSTFHGRSAACAKAGAVAGTLLVPQVHQALGISWLMLMQVAVCLVCVAVGMLFIKGTQPPRSGEKASVETIKPGTIGDSKCT